MVLINSIKHCECRERAEESKNAQRDFNTLIIDIYLSNVCTYTSAIDNKVKRNKKDGDDTERQL